jgi:hypothetical protein
MPEARTINNEKVKLVSNCCKANAYVNYGEEGTNFYVCSHCSQGCDLVPMPAFCCLCGKHHAENECKFFSKKDEEAIANRIKEKLNTPPYDWDKRLPEIKEAGKRLKQYEDANLDIWDRFGNDFAKYYGNVHCGEDNPMILLKDAKVFFKQEIENLLKEMIGEEVEDDYVCEYTSGAVFGANKKRENLINLAAKHGFNVK